MEGDQQPDEGPGEGLGFDLLDDGIDSLSAAVLDCMPSPPDSAALYRQLGISTDGTDNLGLDLGAGGDYGLGVPVPDTPSSFLGDPAPSATLDLFPMPGGAGVKTEVRDVILGPTIMPEHRLIHAFVASRAPAATFTVAERTNPPRQQR